MVIHGGIDGYSRSIVYLHCSDNNRATTVFQCFREAVLSYGLPSRVRSDRGGENVCIATYMLSHPEWGTGTGSFITGHGVHNSRIEHLWRRFPNLYHPVLHLQSPGRQAVPLNHNCSGVRPFSLCMGWLFHVCRNIVRLVLLFGRNT